MDLAATVAALRDMGFRLDMIMPADDPASAVLSRDGLVVQVGTAPAPALALEVPPLVPSLVVTRAGGASVVGRAGMEYRDLIPDRQGGRFIASHIRIPEGGPVPDDVHFHDVRFQVIVCRAGWVRVVYEDQGEPFVLTPGDVVLQPPGIRHRVLEASPGLEVIEVGCPAQHPTYLDHALSLPTTVLAPDRDFGGQRFVHHVARDAPWTPSSVPGWEARETAVASATDGLAGVRHLRPSGSAVGPWSHTGELCLRYVTTGSVTVLGETLRQDDTIVIPPGMEHVLTPLAPQTDLLEITLPA
ncbi:MAG TPA: AraC family ligand binding domain-containing protein [Iamia sp.]|nr:AraC family ligand binding domain-containing protein [Iamia sp.]